jgi:hypothetical protein
MENQQPGQPIQMQPETLPGTLKREDLEYKDDWDIGVLKGAVDVMLEQDKQTAQFLYQMAMNDQTNYMDKGFAIKNLVETIAPRESKSILKTPIELQKEQFVDNKMQELTQKENQLNQMAQALQAQQQGQPSDTKKPSESISFKDLPPEGQVQMAAQAGIKLSLPQQQSLHPAAVKAQETEKQFVQELQSKGATSQDISKLLPIFRQEYIKREMAQQGAPQQTPQAQPQNPPQGQGVDVQGSTQGGMPQ